MTLNPLRVMDSPEEPIFTAKAEDSDGKDPCPSAGECPCREIQYSFGAGPDNVFYYIDTSTGQVGARFGLPLVSGNGTCGVAASTSAFLSCLHCYCAGTSLAWGLNLRALECGIF